MGASAIAAPRRWPQPFLATLQSRLGDGLRRTRSTQSTRSTARGISAMGVRRWHEWVEMSKQEVSPASGDSGPREGLRRRRSEGGLLTPFAPVRR